MDTRSVTRPPLPSTRSILAGAHLCDQVSALLLIAPKTPGKPSSGSRSRRS
jgi:hypothetical protein